MQLDQVAQYGKHGTGPEIKGVIGRRDELPMLLQTLDLFDSFTATSDDSVDSLWCDLCVAWTLVKLAFCTVVGVLAVKREVRQN